MCFRWSLKDTWTIGISWLCTNHRVDIWFWEGSLLFPKHHFILFEFSVCENNNYNVYFLKSFKCNIGIVLSLKLESTKAKAAVNCPFFSTLFGQNLPDSVLRVVHILPHFASFNLCRNLTRQVLLSSLYRQGNRV